MIRQPGRIVRKIKPIILFTGISLITIGSSIAQASDNAKAKIARNILEIYNSELNFIYKDGNGIYTKHDIAFSSDSCTIENGWRDSDTKYYIDLRKVNIQLDLNSGLLDNMAFDCIPTSSQCMPSSQINQESGQNYRTHTNGIYVGYAGSGITRAQSLKNFTFQLARLKSECTGKPYKIKVVDHLKPVQNANEIRDQNNKDYCKQLYIGKAVKVLFYGMDYAGVITGISSANGVASVKITERTRTGEVHEFRCSEYF